MEKSKIFEQINFCIANNELFESINALEQLIELCQPEASNLPILLLGELKAFENQKMLGTISSEDEQLRRNKIAVRIHSASSDVYSGRKLDVQVTSNSFDELRINTLNQLQYEFKNKKGHFFKKYVESVYFNRKQPRNEFDKFVRQSEKRCYTLTGKAGKGKTTFFCNLALSLIKDAPFNKIPILINSLELDLNKKSLEQEILKRLGGIELNQIGEMFRKKNIQLVVFIDAINELEGVDIFKVFNQQFNNLIEKTNSNKHPFLFCVSCRSDFWKFFNNEPWAADNTFNHRQGLSEQPTYEVEDFDEEFIDGIIKTYFYWFGLEGRLINRAREQCKDPLMLRYFCEANTTRSSNDRDTLPSELEIRHVGDVGALQRKNVFDLFVENIRKRMYDRVDRTFRSRHEEQDLYQYTTRYLINLCRVMYEKKQACITLEDAFEVAHLLKHPDSTLSIQEFYSPKSIFYMFIDEGLILDRYKDRAFYFVFESYFEYSLGRYIALEQWTDMLNEPNGEERILKHLCDLLLSHDVLVKNGDFTNLLGAIQYAILVTETDKKYEGQSELFLNIIENVLMSKDSLLVHRQTIFATLRMTALCAGINHSITLNTNQDKLVIRALDILYEFARKAEDFVIQWDLVNTLVEMGKTHTDIVFQKMIEWATESENEIVPQICSLQTIAQLVFLNLKLKEGVDALSMLSTWKEYRKNFWLARIIIFAAGEIGRNPDMRKDIQIIKKLWDMLLELVKAPEVNVHAKAYAYSLLPYLSQNEKRKTTQIVDLLRSNQVSTWGIWNLIYELKYWKNYDNIRQSAWIWELLQSAVDKDNPHINYAVHVTLDQLGTVSGVIEKEIVESRIRSNLWLYKQRHFSGRLLDPTKTHKTGIVYSPVFLEPTYENHIECRQRLQAILSKLLEIGEEHFNWVQPLEAEDKLIEKIHCERNDRHRDSSAWPNYLIDVKTASNMLLNNKSDKTHHGPAELRYESYNVAKLSAGAVVSAVDYVFQNPANAAWSLGRPPGHLANNSICILNNIAIGAHYAHIEYDITRILIIDCDAHHGKHTAWVFRDNPNTVYFSVHIEGGYAKEEGQLENTGVDKGEGYNFNIIYPRYSDDRAYKYIIDQLLMPMASKFQPELIMISAGFDGHFSDDLNPGSKFSEKAFIYLAQKILELAKQNRAKVVGAIEGGYGLAGLANSVVHMMNEIGEWGVTEDEIGFVPGHLNNSDDELLLVMENVQKRILLMQEQKKINPAYVLQ